MQVGSLAPETVAIQVEAARLMPEQVQQRRCKGHRHDKRQAMVANAQLADLLLPSVMSAEGPRSISVRFTSCMPPVVGVSTHTGRHSRGEVKALDRDGKPETKKPAQGGLL